MKTIFIIFTIHETCGRCNPQELYAIINEIRPDVIFEELSVANFKKSYAQHLLKTVETDAIKMYLQSHSVMQIPVDTYPLPVDYDDDLYKLLRAVESGVPKQSFDYRNAINSKNSMLQKYGFALLNNDHNDVIIDHINQLKEEVLRVKNNQRLSEINTMMSRIVEEREHKILTNIVDYCDKHHFDTGLLFIGSGHRKAIMKKIGEDNRYQDKGIIWKWYNDIILNK